MTTSARSPTHMLTSCPMSSPSKCAECGGPYTALRWDQAFCSRACKTTFANRAANRGKQIQALAYGWRFDRGHSKAYLLGMGRLIARWADEDRAAGRKVGPAHLTTEQRSLMGLPLYGNPWRDDSGG